ncbi:MAG TPA: hypothetical protein VN946_06895, partial [Terriglobales bacterium]|nr:hypothetical protein [Terriglobales bacterium]
AWRYVQPAERRGVAAGFPSPTLKSATRRSLIFVPVSLLLFLIMSLLPTSNIEAAVIERSLRENADDPSDPQNIREVKKTLIRAEASNIKVNPNVVEREGKRFLNASTNDPDVWKTALAFVDFRSFLNSQLLDSSKFAAYEATNYHIPAGHVLVPPSDVAQSSVGSKSPDIPQFRELDEPDKNQSVSVGPSFLLFKGGVLVIDDLYLKRIIFRNTTIAYRGGRIVLENVVFLDCTFDITQGPKGQSVAAALLGGPSVNFNA